ncbi:MAG: radical SAM protein, partial [Bacteroidales bacterium]
MDFIFPVKRSAFQVMLKPVGPVCNLDCTYCYYLEKKNLYPYAKGFRLNDDLLEQFIKEYIEAQDVPVVSFVWQGGEPTLLGVDYFRKAVELQKKYSGGKRIDNALQTNGTLLTDEFCEFLKKENFLVGLSIDGPKDVHDHYRLTVKGEPSWDRVMDGLKLLKKHGVEFNTLSVVNRKTSEKPLEVYRFLKQIGSGFIQFIPIVERHTSDPGEDDVHLVHHQYKGDAWVTDWSVVPLQYGKFMSAIFDEWVRNDVGRYYV